MKAHIIKSGKIINTIIVDSLSFMPNLVDGENEFSIGDFFDGEKFSKAEPIIQPPTPEGNIVNDKAKLDAVNKDAMEYLRYWIAKQPDAPKSIKDYVEAGKK